MFTNSAGRCTLYGYLGAALEEVGTRRSGLDPATGFAAAGDRRFAQGDAGGRRSGIAEHAEKLAEFQQALFNDVRETFESLQHQDDSAPLRVEDLPPALRDQFVGVTGKFLLQVYPKDDVWQRANQEKFVARFADRGSRMSPARRCSFTNTRRC